MPPLCGSSTWRTTSSLFFLCCEKWRRYAYSHTAAAGWVRWLALVSSVSTCWLLSACWIALLAFLFCIAPSAVLSRRVKSNISRIRSQLAESGHFRAIFSHARICAACLCLSLPHLITAACARSPSSGCAQLKRPRAILHGEPWYNCRCWRDACGASLCLVASISFALKHSLFAGGVAGWARRAGDVGALRNSSCW